VLLHFCRCRLLRRPRKSDAILQGLRAYDFPVTKSGLKEGWITIAIIVVADSLDFELLSADEKINSFADATGDSVPCEQVACCLAPWGRC
jgi:hypothetical protein